MPGLFVGLQRSKINFSMRNLFHASLALFFYQFGPLKKEGLQFWMEKKKLKMFARLNFPQEQTFQFSLI